MLLGSLCFDLQYSCKKHYACSIFCKQHFETHSGGLLITKTVCCLILKVPVMIQQTEFLVFIFSSSVRNTRTAIVVTPVVCVRVCICVPPFCHTVLKFFKCLYLNSHLPQTTFIFGTWLLGRVCDFIRRDLWVHALGWC